VPSPSVVHTQLTDSRIARLSNRDQAKDLFVRDKDLRGFGLRISPTNVKSFFVEATVSGRFTRKVLGRHPLLSAGEARTRALEALTQLSRGLLPRCNDKPSGPHLSGLAEAFVRDRADVLRQSTLRDYRAILSGVYFADWHSRSVRDLRRQEILERYRGLCSKHGVATANRAMRTLSAMLNYGHAVYPELEEWSNPVRVLAEARARRPLKPRTTHIAKDKLAGWLAAVDAYRTNTRPQESQRRRDDVWLLLHLLIMTGLRSKEARSLRWKEIDLSNGTLTVREESAKNHREAVLPLNDWLVQQLSTRQVLPESFVFEAPTAPGYIDNLNRPLAEIQDHVGFRITAHDLRRTYATYLDTVAAPFGVIKQLLNHVSGTDITSQYIQKRGVDELRIYANRVLGLIESASRRHPSPRQPAIADGCMVVSGSSI